MSKGIVRVKLQSLQLKADGPVGKDSFSLKLQVGKTTSNIKLKGFSADLKGDSHLFTIDESAKLEISLFEKESSSKMAYAEMGLHPLIAMPDTEHRIKVHLIYRTKKELENAEAGLLLISLKYNNNLKNALLDIRIDKAVLLRDTELIGKMDPFVEMVLGAHSKRTTVKDNAGKNPVWIELYTLPVMNQLEPLKLTVFDEDVTTNDLVGDALLDLKDRGLLQEKDGLFTEFKLDIQYEGQKAGELFLATRYKAAG